MFERFTHAAFLGVRRFKNDITKDQGGGGDGIGDPIGDGQ